MAEAPFVGSQADGRSCRVADIDERMLRDAHAVVDMCRTLAGLDEGGLVAGIELENSIVSGNANAPLAAARDTACTGRFCATNSRAIALPIPLLAPMTTCALTSGPF